MKRSKKQLLALSAVVLLLASCATKPKTPEPEPQPQPEVQQPAPQPEQPAVSQDELDSLLAQAQAEKKRAFDLKLNDLIPDEYKTADAAYAEGKASYDAKDGAKAKDQLSTAISLFKALNEKGVVQIEGQRKKAADEQKAAGEKSGADAAFASRWEAANKAYADADAAAQKGDHDAAIASYERARAIYELAYKREKASTQRDTISEKNYSSWDAGNFDLAEKKYAEEEETYAAIGDSASDASKNGDSIAKANDSLDEAILRYNLVIQKGREGVAGANKQKSDDAKAESDSVKASVAVKDDYAAAQAVYQEAMDALDKKDYETAASKFEEAATLFGQVYQSAAAKKAAADSAMKAAEAASQASLEKAQEADSSSGTK